MADVAASLKNWSITLGSNAPATSTTIGTGLAPNLQQIQATLRNELGTRAASITAAATSDIGVKDEGTILITNAVGTVAITSFGAVSAGIKKLVTFSVTGGALSITHNATSLILPSAATVTVADGESLLAESLGAGNWKVHAYFKNTTTGTVVFTDIQNQTSNSFTTTGASDTFLGSTTPALTALVANKTRVNITFHVAPASTPSLTVNATTTSGLRYVDSAGVKQILSSSQVIAGFNADAIWDGTYWVVAEILPAAVLPTASFPEIAARTSFTRTVTPQGLQALIVQGTAVATTSGTSIDFTGIPSWAKRITLMLNGVSTVGINNYLAQLGSGAIETITYVSQSGNRGGEVSATNGFLLTTSITAASLLGGAVTFTLLGNNIWTSAGVLIGGSSIPSICGGYKTFSGVIDRLRFTTTTGVDTFDAGSINVMYE